MPNEKWKTEKSEKFGKKFITPETFVLRENDTLEWVFLLRIVLFWKNEGRETSTCKEIEKK